MLLEEPDQFRPRHSYHGRTERWVCQEPVILRLSLPKTRFVLERLMLRPTVPRLRGDLYFCLAPADPSRCWALARLGLAKMASAQKSLTCARLLATLQGMRAAIWTVAGFRSALCARRDLLLEILALRHQLCVLARSDRRFRPSHRLLWLCLRRVWPRWREELVLVQPATVPHWHREGFRGCWSRRARRRPGRPCID